MPDQGRAAYDAVREALTRTTTQPLDVQVTAVFGALTDLPVEQCMDAMGMRRAGPFGADGHGIGCAYRRGHDCDCTARTATYWTEG